MYQKLGNVGLSQAWTGLLVFLYSEELMDFPGGPLVKWSQWSMQGTQVQSLLWEDPIVCRAAVKESLYPVHALKPMLCNKASHHNEAYSRQLEKAHTLAMKTQSNQKFKNKLNNKTLGTIMILDYCVLVRFGVSKTKTPSWPGIRSPY